MSSLLLRVFSLFILLLSHPLMAAEPRLSPDAWEQQRSLVLAGQPVYLFLGKEGELTAPQRVVRVAARMRGLDAADAAFLYWLRRMQPAPVRRTGYQ